MKPSNRMTYVVKALVDLALHQGSGPVTVGSVAKRQGIPLRYLEQIFNRLRRFGLVAAERGPRGGYRLKLPPGEIPMSAVFDCLEPKKAAPTDLLWQQVEAAVQTTLKATTLEQLVEQARESNRFLDHSYTFHI